MKKFDISGWDYAVIGFGLAFMFGIAYQQGGEAMLIVPIVAIVIGAVIYALKFIFGKGNLEKIDDAVVAINKKLGIIKIIKDISTWALILVFVLSIGWFAIKVFGTLLQWLKTGYWGLYDYEPACESLKFSCMPNTTFVKIDEFLFWLGHFDITIFLFLSVILIVASWAWIIKLSKEDE